jgi:hypothetical protein
MLMLMQIKRLAMFRTLNFCHKSAFWGAPLDAVMHKTLLFIRVLANHYFCIVYLRPEMKKYR